MSDEAAGTSGRIPLGRATVPVQFGEQVIVSILYNHDANPVHHRPDHAVQWMLGLFSAGGVGSEGGLEKASPEERVYALGTRLLARPDVVVMPGIVLAAMCYERFVPPTELTVSLTTTFTYPLLVPTKGSVEVSVEAWEVPTLSPSASKIPGCRTVQIEAFGPGVAGTPVRLLKMEAIVFRAGTSAERVYQEFVQAQFAETGKLAGKLPHMPALSHSSAISQEDRRRYVRIVEPSGIGSVHVERQPHPITECAWQCKIPRVLTEVTDHLRHSEPYLAEVRAYYAGRADEAERREAIQRYAAKEIRYNWLKEDQAEARVNELMEMRAHLYARQHTIFDPRRFREGGAATATGVPVIFDLQLAEIRLRRGIHRLYTCGRLKDDPVFMGEATVTAQPLVTRELAAFLCEINHAFDTLRLLEYRLRA